jgi:hypothetical protein
MTQFSNNPNFQKRVYHDDIEQHQTETPPSTSLSSPPSTPLRTELELLETINLQANSTIDFTL